VSAPLDVPPQITAAMGHPTAWIGNPDVRPPEDIIRMEPETGWRGGSAGSRMHAVRLPSGTITLGCKPNGADTEVRPPATRWLVPGHGRLWGWAQRGFGWMRIGCPAGRLPSDPNPAERTQRSAPPRPVVRTLATGGFGGGFSGDTDSCGLAARRDGSTLISIRWQSSDGNPSVKFAAGETFHVGGFGACSNPRGPRLVYGLG